MNSIGLVILFVLLNYVVISFLEHFIHRHVMHRKFLPRSAYQKNPLLIISI